MSQYNVDATIEEKQLCQFTVVRPGSKSYLDLSDYSTLAAAITAIGSNERSLLVAKATTVGTDLTVPANVHLVVMKPGMITVSTGVTLTINGLFVAEKYQVFSCSGTGRVVFGTGAVSEVHPAWWGYSATDDTPNFAAAVASVTDGTPIHVANHTLALGGYFGGAEPNRLNYCVAAQTKMHLKGDYGKSKIKLADSQVGTAPYKAIAMFASASALSKIVIEGIEFDLNGANNDMAGAVKMQAVLAFCYDDGRGDDIKIRDCYIHDSYGGNVIVTTSSTDSATYVMGQRWRIYRNLFYDCGDPDMSDHSTIWGWAEKMTIEDNDFILTTPPTPTNVHCAAEIHGARSKFKDNRITNYTQMLWVAPNFTSAVEDIKVQDNVGTGLSAYGIRFYRAQTGEPQVNQPVRHVKIYGNQLEFLDTYAAIGVEISCELSISDVEIVANTFRKTSGTTFSAKGTYVACSLAGEIHTNIVIERNHYEGVHRGVDLYTTTGGGIVKRIRVRDNRFHNLRGSYPIGVNLFPEYDAVEIDDGEISENSFTNDEGTNTCIGINIAGYFNVLRVDNNHYKNMGTSNLRQVDLDDITTKEGSELP